MPEPFRFIADKPRFMTLPVRVVAAKSGSRAARLRFVPVRFRLIREPFS
jgi:hypothetical protein